jgi:GT2 family glycosyltransferase
MIPPSPGTWLWVEVALPGHGPAAVSLVIEDPARPGSGRSVEIPHPGGAVPRKRILQAPGSRGRVRLAEQAPQGAVLRWHPLPEPLARWRMVAKLARRQGGGGWMRRCASWWAGSARALWHDYDRACGGPGGDAERLEHHEEAIRRLAEPPPAIGPRISVVMPVHDALPEHLEAAVGSVLAQSYEGWQLCLADDGSTSPGTVRWLRHQVPQDPRIALVHRSVTGHIAAATNSALALADGEWIAFLDHDDLLHPHALALIVRAVAEHPDLEAVYTDEDFIAPAGHRHSPHHKPAWNPELLRSHNYVTHLLCVRRSTLDRIGGIRAGFDGAQDYDLVLRLLDGVEPWRIGHIPLRLYHWRQSATSTAGGAGAKHYAVDAGRRALLDHARRRGLPAPQVEPLATSCYYRLLWPVPGPAARTSVIIPTKDRADLLERCVDSLRRAPGMPLHEIVIVSNNTSTDRMRRLLGSLALQPGVRVLHHEGPFNWSAVNGTGVAAATGDLLLFLNDDTEALSPGWLAEMAALAVRPGTGCVGARLLYPDGRVQHGGVILGLGGYAAHAHRREPKDRPGYFNRLQVRQSISAVTGACMLVRRSVFADAGGFDPAYAVAYNDVDFCLRVAAMGLENVYTPFAEFLHHESVSRGDETDPRSLARFQEEKDRLARRWAAMLADDPAYNPNLTRDEEDFRPRNPPFPLPLVRRAPWTAT